MSWLLCCLHIFEQNPQGQPYSWSGLKFFVMESVLIVIVLGGLHLCVQRIFQNLIRRLNISTINNAITLRLDKAVVVILFLEVVIIYQIAELSFKILVL